MIKTNKVVTVATLLLVLCILPGATNINLGYPQTFKSVAGRISFDHSMAVPVAFVAPFAWAQFGGVVGQH